MSRTERQQEIAKSLAQEFGIDGERILFLNEEKPEEPWLPAEALVTIARQSGNFQAIEESFNQFIPQLNQVVHSATAIDRDGRSYTRSGVATIGERKEIDDHALAAGRAVSAALTAAGFNPLRPGAVVSIESRRESPSAQALAQDAMSRNSDLRRIHKLAEVKGLVVPGLGGWDRTKYRQFLQENYQTNTAAGFNATERASLINALERLPDAIVDEFADVA